MPEWEFGPPCEITQELAHAKKHGETRSRVNSSVVTPPRLATAFSSSI